MDLGVIDTTLKTVAKVVNLVKNNVTNVYTTKSLADVTKMTRVEPLTIVSKDLINLDWSPDVAQSMLSIFAGYYLQAVAVLTQVNDVEVVRILDKLNPDRDSTGFLLQEDILSRESQLLGKYLSMESHVYSLPTGNQRFSLEATDNSRAIQELSNLSVGKLLNIEINYNKQMQHIKDPNVSTVRIPVNVRLIASSIPNGSISRLLAYKTEDDSVIERFHAWRSGRIEFFRDFIFAQDLIDEFKKANMKDDTNTLQEIIRRVNNSRKYGLLTKNPSLVSASNLFMISEEVARDVEGRLGGKLSNPRIRQKAFDNTYAMIIAVVDREWERVTFYTRGIAQGADLSKRELQSSNKGKGPDIGDILKSLVMGQPPSF